MNTELTTLAAGCFWCVEAVLERIDGVTDAVSGYMGGESPDPTYEAICTGTTGHAEVVQVSFDSEKITFSELLDWFWKLHDPTTTNRQGADIGTQYRSAIFFHSEAQKELAEASKEAADASQMFDSPIVTEITQSVKFWPAEDYHQDFYQRNPSQGYCHAVIPPKLAKLKLL